MLVRLLVVLVLGTSSRALGDVFAYEADSLPLDAGFDLVQNFCDTEEWVADGSFFQRVHLCKGTDPLTGQQSFYTRPITDFIGTENFFLEFRMKTTGDRSEIPFGAPTALAAGSQGPTNYAFRMASDQAKLNRDNLLPIIFVDIQPGVPHTYRLELDTDASYIWYIDGVVADQGVPEGPYPSSNPSITFGARSHSFDSIAEWQYIRWGDIPMDGSGDFDSDGQVDDFDFYYFDECFSGSSVNAGPGCRWADFDADTDVDCKDEAQFQLAWTPPTDPPLLPQCVPVPTVSQWGMIVMGLLMLCAATLVLRCRHDHRRVT